MNQEIFRIENGRVVKDKNPVLLDFYFCVLKGEVLGLVYDNLNEMQCIVDLLTGEIKADSAKFYFDEKRTGESKSQHDLKNQIKAITKKSKVFKNVTVKENLYAITNVLGSSVVNMNMIEKYANDLFGEFKVAIDPNKNMNDCSIYECSIIELLQAYLLKKKLVLLVNLSDFLSSIEMVQYMRLLQILAGRGMSFVIFDNNVNFLIEYTDKLLIMSEGRTVAILDTYECDTDMVFNILYNGMRDVEETDEYRRKFLSFEGEKTIFEFRSVTTDLFANLSFSVKRGEIATLICLENESYDHFRRIFMEGLAVRSGSILFSGEPYTYHDLSGLIKKGLIIIEENPTKTMLFGSHTALSNCYFNLMGKMAGPCITQKYENSIEDAMKDYFDDKDLAAPVAGLETYKQQRLVYCKWLLYSPKLIICMKPFSSVDIHMFDVTKSMILEFSRRGISVLILTSNIADAYIFGMKNIYIKNGTNISKNEFYMASHML